MISPKDLTPGRFYYIVFKNGSSYTVKAETSTHVGAITKNGKESNSVGTVSGATLILEIDEERARTGKVSVLNKSVSSLLDSSY